MATAKVNGLLFEGWWTENVVAEAGAHVAFDDLWRDYRRSVGTPMGRQAFVARLNGLGLKETKRQGVRLRWGVRLKGKDAEEAAPVAPPPASSRAPAARKRATDSDVVRDSPTVFNGGLPTPATVVSLAAANDDDLASARVAAEIFQARVRQRKPTAEGGEGFSNAEDDKYAGQLAMAAAAYAYAAGQPEKFRPFVEMTGKPERASSLGWHILDVLRFLWPWDTAWWKPKTPREDLVCAAALTLAAIEKIDRAEARKLQGEA